MLSPLLATVAALAGLLAPIPGDAAETSQRAPLASRALLLGISRAGERLVVVGDHGIVLLSDDDGHVWRQVVVPTRAMLTAVSFADARHGWAVGHDGVILATADAGASWTAQKSESDLDTVYLDVLFLDSQNGFVAGAYGKFLVTADGGQSWRTSQPVTDELHYNSLSRGQDDTLYLAGESGLLLASHDRGASWSRLEVPYEGSLFVGLEAGPGTLVVAGLRGNVLVSHDRGGNWEPWKGEAKFLVMAGLRLKSGILVLAGQGGNFLLSSDAGANFVPWKPAGFGSGISDLCEGRDGAIITVGEGGVARHSVPSVLPAPTPER